MSEERHQDQENSDLPGVGDQMIMEKVYGDYVHQNPGTRLDGGITNNAMWQGYWSRLIACPSSTYNIPSGAVGEQLVSEKIAEELRGLNSCKWNSKLFIIFSLVVLQCSQDVKRLCDICCQSRRRINAWKAGNFTMLVEDTLYSMEAELSLKQ
jgi:hypothetical protein